MTMTMAIGLLRDGGVRGGHCGKAGGRGFLNEGKLLKARLPRSLEKHEEKQRGK